MRAIFLSIITALLTIAPMVHAAPVATKGGVLIPMAACRMEDGSGPQAFPCLWDAKRHGNGRGRSFVMTSPLESTPVIFVR